MAEDPSFWLILPRALVTRKLREFLSPGEEGIIGGYIKEIVKRIEGPPSGPLTAYGFNWVLQGCANSLPRGHAQVARKFQSTILKALENIEHDGAEAFAEGVRKASEDFPAVRKTS